MEKDTSKEAEGGSEDEVERSYHWRGMPPNGSHGSWGRGAGGRKALQRQTKRLAGEATQFLFAATPCMPRALALHY